MYLPQAFSLEEILQLALGLCHPCTVGSINQKYYRVNISVVVLSIQNIELKIPTVFVSLHSCNHAEITYVFDNYDHFHILCPLT